MADLSQAMRAVCEAAGWPYCEEHDQANRIGGCFHLHQSPEPEHVYWCEFPDRDCICPAVSRHQEAGTP